MATYSSFNLMDTKECRFDLNMTIDKTNETSYKYKFLIAESAVMMKDEEGY